MTPEEKEKLDQLSEENKTLLKQLKQYGLDNDMTLQEVAMKAFNELLTNES